MPALLAVKGIKPTLGKNNFIAVNATIAGDVIAGDDCSFWFNSVVRGDVNSIRIGHRVNIQDGAVIHCTYQKAATTIGDDCSIGHNAIIHGCTLHHHVLVGMGAIIMDHAIIEPFSIVAAGAIVLENTVVESGFIYAGTPARKIKPISAEQRKLLEELPERYMMYTTWFE